MIKKDDGSLSFKAAPEDFPQKHKASILNIGIAETGIELFLMSEFVVFVLYYYYYMFTLVMH